MKKHTNSSGGGIFGYIAPDLSQSVIAVEQGFAATGFDEVNTDAWGDAQLDPWGDQK